MSQLRLAQLPTAYLLETVCHEGLIRCDTVCRDFLDEAKHYQMSQAELLSMTGLPVTERVLPRRSYAGQSQLDPLSHKSLFIVRLYPVVNTPFKTVEY